MKRILIPAALLLATMAAASAQDSAANRTAKEAATAAVQQPAQHPPANANPKPATPEAAPADVESTEAITKALYDVISGPAGQKRDWNRLRSLFAPQAQMMVTGPRADGSWGAVLSVEDYISRVDGPFMRDGFYESEVAHTTETFGRIAHVFTTYQSRRKPDDAKPFQRGINSLQLVNDGKRWWIVNLVWLAESEKYPLPERYLSNH